MKRIIPLCVLIATLGIVFLSGACTSTSKKHDPDFLGNYPVQSLGVLHLNIVKRYSNDLLPRDISFVFEPSTNTVKFHHKMMGDNIWISLKKKERALLRDAIEQYLTAFANKTLTPEGAKKKGHGGYSVAHMKHIRLCDLIISLLLRNGRTSFWPMRQLEQTTVLTALQCGLQFHPHNARMS